ncbi:MAG: hypothetical protein ACM3NF_00965 [Gemmatimonadota bacterium]
MLGLAFAASLTLALDLNSRDSAVLHEDSQALLVQCDLESSDELPSLSLWAALLFPSSAGLRPVTEAVPCAVAAAASGGLSPRARFFALRL